MRDSGDLKSALLNLRRKCLITGALGAAFCAAGFFADRTAFATGYLTAFLFWLGISAGAFPMIMLHALTGGAWGMPVRRLFEITVKTFPLLLVLFLPLLACLQELYPWARPEAAAHDPILQHKAAYLNVPFFSVRALVYFALWMLFAYLLNRGSEEYNRSQEKSAADRLQALGGIGLIVFGLTVTFSSIDWVMSLEPHWFSTIYGMLFIAGDGLAALSFALAAAVMLAKWKPLSQTLTPNRSHDLGNLLLSFVMVWAYVSISQFIIIWSGNLQEEAPWYLVRFGGGWYVWILMIVFLHFALPFFLLLMRGMKRSLKALGMIAGLILIMRWMDLIWYVKPVFVKTVSLHWLDLAPLAAIGGLWLAMWLTLASRTNLAFDYDEALHAPGEKS